MVAVAYKTGAAAEGVVGVDSLGSSPRLTFRAGPGDAVFCPVVSGDASAGSVEEQTKSAFSKLKSCLEARGSSLEKIVATNVYLDNIDDFAKMNGVYATYFPANKPTRTTVQPLAVGAAPAKVRISALALK